MNNKELKEKYDEILKKDYISGDDKKASYFGYEIHLTYKNYFNKKRSQEIEDELKKSGHLDEYKKGSGQELKEKGPIPPKFLSIASSSSFCYFSLRNDGYKYFAKKIENDNFTLSEQISFEKDLNIIPRNKFATAHLDAYFKTKKNEYFFECKCHEFFDTHAKSLKQKYFDEKPNLFVSTGEFKDWFTSKGEIKFGESGIGIEEKSGFDFKQFCAHLMGIERNKDKDLTSHLIYYYCLPKKESLIKEPDIKEKVIQAIVDTLKILNSEKLKKYFGDKIKFHLFIKIDGYTEEPSSEKNTMPVDEYLEYLNKKAQ